VKIRPTWSPWSGECSAGKPRKGFIWQTFVWRHSSKGLGQDVAAPEEENVDVSFIFIVFVFVCSKSYDFLIYSYNASVVVG
jgi:hypothetical protein